MPPKTPTSVTVPTTPIINPQTGQMAFEWIKWFQGIQQSIFNATAVAYGTGAPGGASIEGHLYFDQSSTPWQGYVYQAGAWHAF